MQILKYIKLILSFRQVAEAYKDDNGKDKPVVLSRRLFGVAFTVLAGVVATVTGVELSPVSLDMLADSTKGLTDAVQVAWPHVLGAYGAIMAVVGQIKKEKK